MLGKLFYLKTSMFLLFTTSVCDIKKRNHKFTNLKCCKMSFKAFKMKNQGLKSFYINEKIDNTPSKKGFKRLSGLYAAL